MRKLWAEMNREELLEEQSRWTTNLQRTNLELKTAKRVAAATKKYLPAEEIAKLEEDRVRLSSGLRGIQAEIAKRNAKRSERSFEWYFHDVAYDSMSPEQYDEIADLAEERMQRERSL